MCRSFQLEEGAFFEYCENFVDSCIYFGAFRSSCRGKWVYIVRGAANAMGPGCEARPGLVREIIVWYLNQSPTCESRPDTGCHYPPAHTNYTLYTTHHILQHKLETRWYIVCQHRPQSSSLLIMHSNFESLSFFSNTFYWLDTHNIVHNVDL